MRRILFALVPAVMSCSGNETTAPAALPVESVFIYSFDPMVVGTMRQLHVVLRDASYKVVADRLVTFTSSDVRVATVDASGVVTAIGPGAATITATSEGKNGSRMVNVVRPVSTCTGPSPFDYCSSAEIYVLVSVNDQPLPVDSPWGIGDWDYDSDAGTWQLSDATMILFADGGFTYESSHRAASGLAISETVMGEYERTGDSVTFSVDISAGRSAAISGNSLTYRLSDGTKFTFERFQAGGL